MNTIKIPNKMEQVYVENPEDLAKIGNFYNNFLSFDNHSLVNAYNMEKRLVGVHAQVLYLIALDKAFHTRFQKSPITRGNGYELTLSGPIYYIEALETFDWFNKN